MSAFLDNYLLPVLVGLTLALLTAAVELYRRSWAATAAPRVLRRYALLGTAGADGTLVQHETTRVPGTVITRRIGNQVRRFELTDVPLGDGSFVAEPLDDL